MENTKLVMNSGLKMYKNSKLLLSLLCIGIVGVVLTIVFSGRYATRYLALSGPYFGINLLMGIMYGFIVIGSWGIPSYFIGLVLIGLGQISLNTTPKQNVQSEPVAKPVYPPVVAPAPAVEPAPVVASAPKAEPAPAPAPKAAPQTSGGASLALINGLRVALNEPHDADMIKRLEEAEQRLNRPNEKQIIQRILSAPANQIRPVVQRLYDKFK